MYVRTYVRMCGPMCIGGCGPMCVGGCGPYLHRMVHERYAWEGVVPMHGRVWSPCMGGCGPHAWEGVVPMHGRVWSYVGCYVLSNRLVL